MSGAHPMTWRLPFPPRFADPDAYHRFDGASGRIEEDVADVLVIKTPLKRKPDVEDPETADSNEWTNSPRYVKGVTNPFQTPSSIKGGRICSKYNPLKFKPEYTTPIQYAGSSSNDLTPVSNFRYDNSLGFLTKKFINLLKHAQDGILDLNKAVETLEVQKRRIYDITNVLEGIGLIEKKLKNRISWKGSDDSRPGEVNDVPILEADIKKLHMKERNLDDRISEIKARLKRISEDESTQKFLYVIEEDIKSLPCFQNKTLIAIKAPLSTNMQVPYPDSVRESEGRVENNASYL
ncbi:uncharacterized protein A4U43_C10F16880 [Asparagus officinalis]|uniref:E2F/DP family winged-helix DNA-binding domain-containing protein n=1 Tax=Asparagus officinalis TaxID=4686 RepID=A0A5P1E862_ASPOF|nr:uncharacterized protein A4U43_C10F16880 [Asparagus officinalis]